MLVRPFNQADVAHACSLTNDFIQHTAVHFGIAPQSEPEFAAVWHAGREKYPWLSADVDGAWAGFAKAGVWRAREAYSRTAEVTVYVAPAFHRRGVGRALYSTLLQRLRDSGFHTAVGGITLPNPASVRLHESLGFKHVGIFKEVGRKFDTWHDTSWWQIMLQ